ncbi:pilus assembly protein [Acetobacter musti]|uniref:Pilus assembly protein n=1 Tax=Acetobacter musti TaxID=864732 RepID=A0ABX0JJT0_9PROT|nr:pilus assembly protein [Acetobacter musti]
MVRKSWLQFRNCRRGVSAIEFALVAPVLIILFICGAEIEDAVIVMRKVTTASHTIANLTTQYETMTTDDASLVLAASLLVLEPYSTNPAEMVVSEVSVGSSGTGTVVWSCGLNRAARALNETVTLPAGTDSTASSYLIYGEAWYDYLPPVLSSYLPKFSGSGQSSPYTLSMYESLYMVPRQSSSIPLTAGSGSGDVSLTSGSATVKCNYSSS